MAPLASLEAGNEDDGNDEDKEQVLQAASEFGFPSEADLAAVDVRLAASSPQPAASSVGVAAHGVVWQLPEGTGRKRPDGYQPPPAASSSDTADKAKATKRARKQAAVQGDIDAGKQGTLPK
jgi:hypothetical protein